MGDIAVFWDFENIDAAMGRRTGGRQVDVAGVDAWVRQRGRIVVNRAFGDMSERLKDYETQFAHERIKTVPIYPRRKTRRDPTTRKNIADVVLTINVVEYCLGNTELSEVVIISGDSDFVELADWLRERGLQVTGIACGKVDPLWTSTCDLFVSYESIVSAHQPASRGEDAPTQTPRSRATQKVKSATERVKAAVDKLHPRTANPSANGAAAPEKLHADAAAVCTKAAERMRHESRDELQLGTFGQWMVAASGGRKAQAFGYQTLADMVLDLPELLTLVTVDGQPMVRLAPDAIVPAAAVTATPAPAQDVLEPVRTARLDAAGVAGLAEWLTTVPPRPWPQADLEAGLLEAHGQAGASIRNLLQQCYLTVRTTDQDAWWLTSSDESTVWSLVFHRLLHLPAIRGWSLPSSVTVLDATFTPLRPAAGEVIGRLRRGEPAPVRLHAQAAVLMPRVARIWLPQSGPGSESYRWAHVLERPMHCVAACGSPDQLANSLAAADGAVDPHLAVAAVRHAAGMEPGYGRESLLRQWLDASDLLPRDVPTPILDRTLTRARLVAGLARLADHRAGDIDPPDAAVLAELLPALGDDDRASLSAELQGLLRSA